jgi:exopolyphosphatase/guanosine-5'-triphosphate,3'-diphosphate pyrophosphatase
MPLGSLRVSDRFLTSDPPLEHEMRSLRKAVKSSMREAGIPQIAKGEALVGIGGTVRNLAKVDLRATDYPLPLLHAYRLSDERLGAVVDDLAGRTMKRRSQVPGLNPDRADTIVGGALVIQGIAKHLGAPEVMVSSRGLREGLALATGGSGAPSSEWVRSISVAALAARFRTWTASSAERRTGLAVELIAALDPSMPQRLREMLSHAATLLDIGRAIDYYARFEHAANIVIAADLAGFSHADLGALSAILRQADDDTRLGPFGRLVPEHDRPAVLRAATALTLADELNRRIAPGAPAPISCSLMRAGFEVVAPVPPGWRPRGAAERIRSVFDTELLVVADEAAPVLAPVLEPD